MSYKLTNISGGQIVCDLASGETLRLDNKQSTTIKDSDITEHIRVLEKRGYMLCEEKSSTKRTKKEE